MLQLFPSALKIFTSMPKFIFHKILEQLLDILKKSVHPVKLFEHKIFICPKSFQNFCIGNETFPVAIRIIHLSTSKTSFRYNGERGEERHGDQGGDWGGDEEMDPIRSFPIRAKLPLRLFPKKY